MSENFEHLEPIRLVMLYGVNPYPREEHPVPWDIESFMKGDEKVIKIKILEKGYIVVDLNGKEYACNDFNSLVCQLRNIIGGFNEQS